MPTGAVHVPREANRWLLAVSGLDGNFVSPPEVWACDMPGVIRSKPNRGGLPPFRPDEALTSASSSGRLGIVLILAAKPAFNSY